MIPSVAVCVLPGTELVFDQEIKYEPVMAFLPKRRTAQRLARFRHLNEHKPLCQGQVATVLQLPAGTRPEATMRRDEPAVAQATRG